MPPRPAPIELRDDELRAITGWAAACAHGVLELFEESHPEDTRPREAIDAADAFSAGARRTSALRRAGWAAFHAARETTTPTAADAAHAASHAAGAAFLHPVASAHQVRHVLGAAAHAARAVELSTGTPRWPGRPAPPAVVGMLRRLPAAPAGGGRIGDLMREFDELLRA
ncbi:putative immunity protein [Actinomycetospora sp. TBRC 11914]|uniref:putative immunity protein n=1 Tax=Actinomycetospora sp. TBRC 11914 TaxID=2729387 RepID=UPI00145CBBAF|nr:exonuclease SbcC [Actinomycetospora sp. TBRC 11914]NMO94146.1 exonuclease SbcC [Actinomycetospora sp. TBRC 11914]